MGIIKAVKDTVGGGLADQWLEVIEPNDMGDGTVFTSGVPVRRDNSRGANRKGTPNYITDGSVIHVYDNQFMLLVDGGKVVDYTAEPGYFTVSNSSAPSLFNGQLSETVRETFGRLKFGGVPSALQQVFFINLQEIKGLKFGTKNAINYFDSFYNAELFLRAHGTFSIKITDPLKFYKEAVPRNSVHLNIDEIYSQYLDEFLEALQSAINQMSIDGVRISQVTSKSRELSQYMSETLDESWEQLRGMEVLSVGIASVSYDEKSKELINMRNQGAMLTDPSVREGYVQGALARGIESAGANTAGAGQAFMGVGLGLSAGGSLAGTFTQANQAAIQNNQARPAGWRCPCGQENDPAAKFCGQCGQAKPAAENGWLCACGSSNLTNAKFCGNCGKPRPAARACPKCGQQSTGETKFCSECGSPL